jgi:cation diffusion facilitator CzcD-associated flavoprotein CzcO
LSYEENRMPLDNQSDNRSLATQARRIDVLVVGAGFAGLYLLHCLSKLGLDVRAFEAGGGVGGTWYWNRYPGARCDVESMQYSFGFSEELQQDWQWSELFSAQPEILSYANHVAERFDLRRLITFNARVHAAIFDEASARWTVHTSIGETVTARYIVMATGCLSTGRVPDFPGIETFEGRTFHTGEWPHEPVDFAGRRVAVTGTGSSAIQAIPVIAEQAAHVTVFQRTPNYSIPSRNGPMTCEYETEWKTEYAARRETARHMRNGILYDLNDKSALDDTPEERERTYAERWQKGGVRFMAAYNDLALNQASNDTAADFVRARIREIIKDPAVAELLCPKDYPIGTKRICVDTNYFAAFNRPNVTLVDVRNDPIQAITPAGVRQGGQVCAVDDIVFATGFDAMTGTLTRVDIRGRHGQTLAAKWEAGPRTYLGLMTAGFPNLFMITGPGSPSVLSNMIVSIEQHVDWISDCLAEMGKQDLGCIEPTAEAEEAWVAHVNEVAHRTLYPKAASWYMGANIPGKPRVFLPYIGGVGAYRQKCDDVAANGYEGFVMAPAVTMAK